MSVQTSAVQEQNGEAATLNEKLSRKLCQAILMAVPVMLLIGIAAAILPKH